MRKLFALAGLAGALLLALMASSAAAAPIVEQFHGTFSDTFSDNFCGIDGTSVVERHGQLQVFADGTFNDQFRLNQVFTSTATGKSVLIFVAGQTE